MIKAKQVIEAADKVLQDAEKAVQPVDQKNDSKQEEVENNVVSELLTGKRVKVKVDNAYGTVGLVINHDIAADKVLVKLGAEKLITVSAKDVEVDKEPEENEVDENMSDYPPYILKKVTTGGFEPKVIDEYTIEFKDEATATKALEYIQLAIKLPIAGDIKVEGNRIVFDNVDNYDDEELN